MNETDSDWSRLGDYVKQRREELRLTQAQVQERGGPSPALVRAIENKRADTLSVSKRRDLERALNWSEESVDLILRGGRPFPASVPLPRNAPNAPILSNMDAALGIHPIRPGVSQHMSPAERQLMVKVRNKLYKDNGDFNNDELATLTKFVEDEELRSLHARIDWLPRVEQLEVSELVTELEQRVEMRLVEMGVTNETPFEDLPQDAPMPNPLPREGLLPDPQNFPSQVPTFQQESQEGETHDTDQQESRTSTSSPEHGSTGGRPEDSKPPMNAAEAATDKPQTLNAPDQGDQVDYTLAARKGETEDEKRERLGIPYD